MWCNSLTEFLTLKVGEGPGRKGNSIAEKGVWLSANVLTIFVQEHSPSCDGTSRGGGWPCGLGVCLARRRLWVRVPQRYIPQFFSVGYLLCGSRLMLSKFNCNILGWKTVPFIWYIMLARIQTHVVSCKSPDNTVEWCNFGCNKHYLSWHKIVQLAHAPTSWCELW